MSEQTGPEPGGTPFAPPGGPRPAVDAGRSADEHRPPARGTSPYALPTTGEATPFAPPAVPQPALGYPPYGQAGPYAQPGPYPQADAYGPAVPIAQPPVYGAPAPYGAPVPYGAPPPSYGVPGAYGGPPPYGTPGFPGAPFGYGGVVEPPTDGLAIASLVTSVAGLLVLAGIPGPVGLGLGIGALRRIRRRGTKGRGMAIAGVVVGAVSTLVCIGWVWLAIWASSNPSAVGGLPYEDELPDYTLRSDLVVGDCLREYPGSWDLGTADPVDCGEAHALEIVAVLPMSAPVDALADPSDAGYDRGFAQCTATIERAAPGLLDEWVVWTDVSFPHPDDWSTGATTAYCAVGTDYPELRGSVLDGTVTGPE
ncbi:DUF4190 domain-containing protein [Cellulomonas sp. Leaf334]|uniref:DUF4190 domain-containing protein n=1 Tax=Cellulomonas sp. Leaf334 TaxID=1736339 RepID=UPI00138F3FBF|nr:DUF4190 domain-containing protein [Cellulomonas sp. Leaf334]